ERRGWVHIRSRFQTTPILVRCPFSAGTSRMTSLIKAPETFARSAYLLDDLDVPRFARATLLPHHSNPRSALKSLARLPIRCTWTSARDVSNLTAGGHNTERTDTQVRSVREPCSNRLLSARLA